VLGRGHPITLGTVAIVQNTAGRFGGGIAFGLGDLHVTNSIVAQNKKTDCGTWGPYGGGQAPCP
jgi:predicted outer membrane repeat protein